MTTWTSLLRVLRLLLLFSTLAVSALPHRERDVAHPAADAPPALPPVITRLSQFAGPDEAVLVSGGPFADDCTVQISTTSFTPPMVVEVAPEIGQTTDMGMAFVVPEQFSWDVYEVRIGRCNGSSAFSEPVYLNAPQPWWAQGDLGDTASPGGWIRVHGVALELQGQAAPLRAMRRRLRQARDALLLTPSHAGDSGEDSDSALARAAETFLQAREDLKRMRSIIADQLSRDSAAFAPQLQLTPTFGDGKLAPIILPAVTNYTMYGGAFLLPSDLPPGYYNLSVSNGFGPNTTLGHFGGGDAMRGRSTEGGSGMFVPLDTFVDEDHPHEAGIFVHVPDPWPPGVFVVNTTSTPCMIGQAGCTTSDDALQSALHAAAAAGGGTVFFPQGKYYFSSAIPIIVPPFTRLAGEHMDLVSLYFAEFNTTSAPYAFIQLNDSAVMELGKRTGMGAAPSTPAPSAAWGLQDLTLYVTAFHNSIIWVSNNTNGFTLRRVRARANAFFALDDIGKPTRGRTSSWNASQAGHLVDLHARNFEITDCDLLSTNYVISSMNLATCKTTDPWVCAGARYGYVARNILLNGAGGSHHMVQWQQAIFEQNTATGVSLVSHGQVFGTGEGGVAQHLYHADNSVKCAWGGDRELMTYDTESSSYYGAVASIDEGGVRLTTLHDTLRVSTMKWGGWHGAAVVVLNGTGAGQIRRVVVPGIDNKPTPTNRTWVINSPFAIPPRSGDMIQITPFRGRAIFFRNRYSDGGPVQIYTISYDSIVAEAWAERFEGFVGFGQWRGWNFTADDHGGNRDVDGHAISSSSSSASSFYDHPGYNSLAEPMSVSGMYPATNSFAATSRLGGEMGIGMNPNMHSLYADNEVLEGNTVVNFNSSQVQFETLWYKNHKYITIPISHTPTCPNLFIVYRRNMAMSDGGVWIGENACHVLVERFQASRSATCVDVDNSTTAVLVRRTQCD